ncbi:LmeA family phospholipid-binding protein, partial [Frankia gtarii]|uniref:LmeA family phospholipid-binding protein n=2 Tax=Frankia gtarii TaxID=2950102 RepID=UPI0021C1C962
FRPVRPMDAPGSRSQSRPLPAAGPPVAPATSTAAVRRRGEAGPGWSVPEDAAEGTMIIDRGGAAAAGQPWPGSTRPEAPQTQQPEYQQPEYQQPGYPQSDYAQSVYDQAGYGQQPGHHPQRGAAIGQDGLAGGGGAGQGGFGAGAPPTGTTAAKPPRRRRRRGRLLAIVLVVLVVLFVVGDRVGVVVAKGQMRKQVEASVAENIKPGDPVPKVTDVSIGGFPFLTQVLFGKFTDIGVGIDGIPTPGPKISSVKAHLKGLHVPLGDALTDNVGQVPVDDVRATVGITYADLNAFLAKQAVQVQVAPVDGGKKVELSGTIDGPFGLGSTKVSGITTFEVADNKLTLVPSALSVVGGLNFTIPVSFQIPVPIPVSGLPFHLRIVKASTNATGLSLTATAKDVVLPAS